MVDNDGASWDVDLLSTLRISGMPLVETTTNIFKIYHIEKRIANYGSCVVVTKSAINASTSTFKPVNTPDKAVIVNKGRMIYHLFKVQGSNMTPEEKF